jgi:hypothetical protein
VVNGASFDNLTPLIVRSFINYGGYNEMYIVKKLVYFGANMSYFSKAKIWCDHSVDA